MKLTHIKTIVTLSVVALVLSLTGCGGGAGDQGAEPNKMVQGHGDAGGSGPVFPTDEIALYKMYGMLLQKAGDLVPYTYIVRFYPSTAGAPSPVISHEEFVRANGEPKTPPPFGEHSTGQSKVELAKTLGLTNGWVHGILAVTNGAVIIMTDDEADILRKDPRVEEVTQERAISM
jgi:hypothetical protein